MGDVETQGHTDAHEPPDVGNQLDPNLLIRCRECARRWPSDKPTLLGRIGQLDNGSWVIHRAERRTIRSYDAHAESGLNQVRQAAVLGDKIEWGFFLQDTPGGKRILSWAHDKDLSTQIGRIRCRRCGRRLPYGRDRLIKLAKSAIASGAKDFLA